MSSYVANWRQLIPCKKRRRSPRLLDKVKVQAARDQVQHGPLGHFDLLPLELKFTVFKHLPGEALLCCDVPFRTLMCLELQVFQLGI